MYCRTYCRHRRDAAEYARIMAHIASDLSSAYDRLRICPAAVPPHACAIPLPCSAMSAHIFCSYGGVSCVRQSTHMTYALPHLTSACMRCNFIMRQTHSLPDTRRIQPRTAVSCRAPPHYAAHRTMPRITASCHAPPHHAAHYRIMPLTTSPYRLPPHHSAPSSSGCRLRPSSAASAPSRISSMRATSELGLLTGSSCSMGRKCMCL